MNQGQQTDLEYLLPRISRWSGGLAVVVGILVSCGWAFDVATLRSLLPGVPQMKFNAALAFVLAGSSVWLVNDSSAAYRTAARLCAAATVLIGLLTLSEYLFGRSLGIDQLFVQDLTADGASPGRIPLTVAVNFALLGAAVLLLDHRGENDRGLPQWLAMIIAFISFTVILGYAYDITPIYRALASSPMVLHGAILFVLLAISVLFARPKRWPMTRAITHEPGGLLIRRMLPATILVPPTVGWIRLRGEQAGLYGADLGLALFATATVIIFSVLIWSTARAVRRADQQRQVAQEELHVRQLGEQAALATSQAQRYTSLQREYDDLRHSQHTIVQQERLRALGQMARGVAHDINNAISPIALYTESLLGSEPNLSDRARRYLAAIQCATEDVAQTVSRMREFHRPHEPEYKLTRVHLNCIVEQVVELTHARWSSERQDSAMVIELNRDLAPDLPLVMGTDSEIRDALTNLVFNALDAMPNGGTLTLRTCVISGPQTPENDVPRTVSLEVSDTGAGMDEATRLHCLEPFFTTKGERGAGLGLAMVHGIAQRHSAELLIESTPGRGTTVRLVFSPAAAAAITSVPSAPKQLLPPLRILIVDDDPMVIEALLYVLQHEGHQVTAADGGEAGVEAFMAAQGHGEQFHAVITDLGMPHIDGRHVAMAIKAASPTTPVILLTGWGQQLLADNEVPPHVDRVLNKPPTLDELRRALMELVAPEPAPGTPVPA